jgi:hypothetical protein
LARAELATIAFLIIRSAFSAFSVSVSLGPLAQALNVSSQLRLMLRQPV